MKSAILKIIFGALCAAALFAAPASAQSPATSGAPIVLAQKANKPLTPEEKKALQLKRQKARKALQQKRQKARKAQQQKRQRANQKKKPAPKRLAPSQAYRAKQAAPKKNAAPAKKKLTPQQKLQLQKRRQAERLKAQKKLQKQRQKQRINNKQANEALKDKRQRRLERMKRDRQQNREDLQKQRARARDRLQDQRQQNRTLEQAKQKRLQTNRAANRATLARRRQVQRRKVQRDNQKYRALAARRKNLRSAIQPRRNAQKRLAARNAVLRRQNTWLKNQRRRNNFRGSYRNFGFRERAKVVKRRNNRVIYTALAAGALIGAAATAAYYIHHNDDSRLDWHARDYYAEDLSNGWTRSIVVRPDGSRVVTVRDSGGFIVRRYRVYPGNRVTVLFDNQPSWWEDDDIEVHVDPVRYRGPRDHYIVEPSNASVENVYEAITAEPVAEIGRYYTLNQILVNNDLRGYMPRIDLDTITFATGSDEIPVGQIDKLEAVGAAMEEAIKENPNEVYLIEGHTDATGDKIDNLDLSDRRAAAVANALTEYFDIPPENLVTQGYGEQFLKIDTLAPERRNRRVAIRRITPLLATESDKIALDDNGNEVFDKD